MRVKTIESTPTRKPKSRAPAQASGLHWFQGQTPTVTNNGTSIEASGQVAGAGTFIVATLTVHYTFPVLCFNPGSDAGPVPGLPVQLRLWSLS